MKLFIVLTALMLVGCSSYLSPEETVNRNVVACMEGDASTRWALLSKGAQEKMLKKNPKHKILDRFSKEAWMYKIIQSWETEIIEEKENSVKLKFKYKYQDPHSLSKKVVNASDDITLVKEEGLWKISD